jgi:hypothetical protein
MGLATAPPVPWHHTLTTSAPKHAPMHTSKPPLARTPPPHPSTPTCTFMTKMDSVAVPPNTTLTRQSMGGRNLQGAAGAEHAGQTGR